MSHTKARVGLSQSLVYKTWEGPACSSIALDLEEHTNAPKVCTPHTTQQALRFTPSTRKAHPCSIIYLSPLIRSHTYTVACTLIVCTYSKVAANQHTVSQEPHRLHTNTHKLYAHTHTHTHYSIHILILHIWPTLKHTLVTYLHTSNICLTI